MDESSTPRYFLTVPAAGKFDAAFLPVTSIDDIRSALLASPRVKPVGGGTKPALGGAADGGTALPLKDYTGIVEYLPDEFTITARAGTPLAEIGAALARNGQYLPFDPPLVEAGATLGGTIAAGANGPGRLRYGGLRDFILGTVFLAGDGRLIHGGGKVVKNAAGFDFPKLLVGSAGRLGVILEATFKVFPRPRSWAVVQVPMGSVGEAVKAIGSLNRLAVDFDALELTSDGTLHARIGGDEGTLAARMARLRSLSGLEWQADDAAVWSGWQKVLGARIPVTLSQIPSLDPAVAALGHSRRYSVAGNLAVIEAPNPTLSRLLASMGLRGLCFDGAVPRVGDWETVDLVERRLLPVLDPTGRLSGVALS